MLIEAFRNYSTRFILLGLSLMSGLLIGWLGGEVPTAIANMANPFTPGDLVSEPWISVATLDILHEDLVFDLRPLAERRSATITATYQIYNPASANTVELLFVAPGLETGRVTLDGEEAIAAVKTEVPSIPEEWQMVETEPTLQGLQFAVPLTPGEHAIAVEYNARPSSDNGNPYRQYQLDYWLSPARQWQSFGTLTVDVFTPPNWQVDLAPHLDQQTDNHWQSTFSGLPADRLTLTAYPVLPLLTQLLRLGLLSSSWGLAAIGNWWIFQRLGCRAQRSRWSRGRLIWVLGVLMLLSMSLFVAVISLGAWAAESLLDSRHLISNYVYTRFYGWALAALIGAAIAPIISILAFLAGRKAGRKGKMPS